MMLNTRSWLFRLHWIVVGIVNCSEIVQTFGLVALYISVFITPAIVNSGLELIGLIVTPEIPRIYKHLIEVNASSYKVYRATDQVFIQLHYNLVKNVSIICMVLIHSAFEKWIFYLLSK